MTRYTPNSDSKKRLETKKETKRNKTKKKKWPIILIIAIDVVLLLVLIVALVFSHLTSGLNQVELETDDLGIVEIPTMVDDEGNVIENRIVNIAMFGVDSRDSSARLGDQYRSDSIIITSIDPEHNVVKMTSILRDSKVPIEGHDAQKINAAYKYGGPQLAIKTLNQNFQLDIADYVTVDFGELSTVIDIIGGVEIELTQDESDYINYYAAAELGYEGEDTVAGVNNLHGLQAVMYSRIRALDSDYYRAGRQQTVLTAIFNKLKDTPKSQYPSLIKDLLSCIETSLSYTDILGFATTIDLSSAELVKNTIPDAEFEDGLWGGIDDTGSWVWVYDLDAAAERIHSIIYEN